jgi:hypothetical protein
MGTKLPEMIRIAGSGVRPVVRTLEEALRLIDRELPCELFKLPRWTFARELLVIASRTQSKRDVMTAVRQFRQALSNEGWLVDDTAAAES